MPASRTHFIRANASYEKNRGFWPRKIYQVDFTKNPNFFGKMLYRNFRAQKPQFSPQMNDISFINYEPVFTIYLAISTHYYQHRRPFKPYFHYTASRRFCRAGFHYYLMMLLPRPAQFRIASLPPPRQAISIFELRYFVIN
jgi:hypothetical protein